MKIFIYSDLHISRTSSILPQIEGKYSYRQQMILKTGEWLASIIEEHKPDVIINLGDTFDQHTITSYDIDTASKFFSNFEKFKIPHIVLVGNHEMVNKDFNAIALLKNINNIWVIDEPSKITLNNNNKSEVLAFLPYDNYKNIKEFPEGKYLFSHLDIQGSSIRAGIKLKDGLTHDQLKQYTFVFNGHIHKQSIVGNTVNVGSITTHSFSDDEETIPTAYIFDTETSRFEMFKSKCCPLFKKVEINSIEELDAYLSKLDKDFKYCLHVICPFELKDTVKQQLENNDLIISNRINVKIDKEVTQEIDNNLNVQTNIDIIQTFEEFLNKEDIELKYPKGLYKTILEELK